MGSTAASQQEGSGFESPIPRGLSVWSLHVLPVFAWVFSGYSGFLPQSKDMQLRLIGECKLSLGVSVGVNGVCVCPAMDWRPVQGVSLPLAR